VSVRSSPTKKKKVFQLVFFTHRILLYSYHRFITEFYLRGREEDQTKTETVLSDSSFLAGDWMLSKVAATISIFVVKKADEFFFSPPLSL